MTTGRVTPCCIDGDQSGEVMYRYKNFRLPQPTAHRDLIARLFVGHRAARLP